MSDWIKKNQTLMMNQTNGFRKRKKRVNTLLKNLILMMNHQVGLLKNLKMKANLNLGLLKKIKVKKHLMLVLNTVVT
jgi:hypothetical protein